MSFVFYDTETTGVDTSFDQILQFGAIRTDHDLNELERFEIRSQILPHIVPSPGAMRVTGVTVAQLTDTSLPTHYQMVAAIKAKLDEWSPAIFIGHNSLGFDEHLLRQAFFQNLHPPYLTNTNGNCRSDSLRILQAIALYEPGIITVPINEKGKPSFKLDQLAPINGFADMDAHDAMGDVEAMIHMCKILAENSDIHWSNFVRFAQKAAVSDFIQDEEVFSLTDFFYGKPYSWMVTTIGQNPNNGSESIVFNLSVDPGELISLDDDELAKRLASQPKPVRSLRTNACPCILAYDDAPDNLKAAGPDLDELERRVSVLTSEEGFRERLVSAFLSTREDKEPSPHVEKQIYDGFSGNGDQALMTQFHSVEWGQRFQLLDQFSDNRLKPLGERLIYAEASEAMPPEAKSNHEIMIAQRLMADDDSVPWLTLPKAIADTDDFLAMATGDEAALLGDLRNYLADRAERAASLIT
ncbi:MAG: exonuclease domain-containing protein [Rhodospirillales bacterium]